VACHGNSGTEPTSISASNNTYYIASQESGADNEKCNGQAPTNQGNGNCPFRDFTGIKPLHLLDSAKGVTLFVPPGQLHAHPGDRRERRGLVGGRSRHARGLSGRDRRVRRA
jgi:hypothetical protein